MFPHLLLQDFDAHVRIVDRLDAVPDAHDQLALLAHRVDELHGNEARVVGLGELLGRSVQRAAEPVTLA